MDKKQREERRRQEDIALQRGLLWVAGAIVLEALLIFIDRYYINYRIDDLGIDLMIVLGGVLRVLRFAAPVAVGACLGCLIWKLKVGKGYEPFVVLALVFAALAVCAHVTIKYQSAGVSMLFWLVVAWAVLALVFYLYQREFFLAASACGMSVLGLWFVRYGAVGRPESILILAAIAVVTGGTLWLKKEDGALPIGGKPLRFLPPKTDYKIPLVTCGASLAVLLGTMLLSDAAAYYLIFVMVAWLFALFVYYTVKLM